MDNFLMRFGERIKGVISGADRLVFKGYLSSLMYVDGVTGFLRYKGVLNRDYKDWAIARSKELVERVERYAISECGRGIEKLIGDEERKKKMVEKRQKALGLKEGLIGVWSAVEACPTYKARFDKEAGFPQLRPDWGRCKHLYQYLDHKEYGHMSVRIQTWLPYCVQIAINGRDWLGKMLAREKIRYVLAGNKFQHVDDYRRAQELLDSQLDVSWPRMLNSFLPQAFPTMRETVGPEMEYYWTLWQGEWATDYIFGDAGQASELMKRLQAHAIATGTYERILGYMCRSLTKDNQPHHNSNPDLSTRAARWHDGCRVKHCLDNNSVKLYNEGNNVRNECTINNPGAFKVYRRKQGAKKTAPKYRLPLRQSVADIPLRAEISKQVNLRFINQMATLHDDTPVKDVLRQVTQTRTKDGRRVRALDVTGKDRELLEALADPKYCVSGVTNKALGKQLKSLAWAKGGTDKQLSARITRNLRLLRDHGLIRKMPQQQKYLLTPAGHQLTTLVTALLASSVQHLMEKIA